MEDNGVYVIFTAQNVDDPQELMRRYPSELPNKYYHHSTNRFGRQPFDEREGEPMRLHITGRLTTDLVDALVVDNPNSDNKIPHITLATAEGVKPFASNAELAAHGDMIEPLDDYVDTTFRNNMGGRRKNESLSRLSRLLLEVLDEKIGGHNYAGRGDEFYTRAQDIQRELGNYDFSGKVVYCNCDDPSMSEFYKYFKQNFSNLGLRGLYATYYSESPKMYYYDGRSEQSKPIESGRFQDNAWVMQKCDVLVTNPPFSDAMPQQLINMARKMGKKFIVVTPLETVRRNDMFDLVKNGSLNFGYTPINRYSTPDGKERTAQTTWLTNMDVQRPDYKTGNSYDPQRYPKYDNYDAIECGSFKNIPDDYYGNIGVPWRFLSVLNRRQFDIVGKVRPTLNGRKLDTRLIIRRRRNVGESVVRRLTEAIMRQLRGN